MKRTNWTLQVIAYCMLFVVVTRPEEVFNTTPPPVRTNFSCLGKAAGFYADVDANCKVYHTCDDYGNKFSYRCPEETAFRQDALICDHAHLVDCQATVRSKTKEESIDKREDPSVASSIKFGTGNASNRRSYSRSFQVIQQPTKSTNKVQPGFVFSSSVFLRDFNEPKIPKKSENLESDGRRSTLAKAMGIDSCNTNRGKTNVKNDIYSSSSIRPFLDRFDSRTEANHFTNSRAQSVTPGGQDRRGGPRKVDSIFNYRNENFEREESYRSNSFSTTSPTKEFIRSDEFYKNIPSSRKEVNEYTTRTAPRDFLKLSFTNNSDYPYFETLRSIQANAKSSTVSSTTTTVKPLPSTTEIPVHALTLSLKPLVPNELEYDPYYPRFPTSTEAYYTPSQSGKEKSHFRTSTQPPRSSIHFEIPAVLPDLNTLEDLVDRRKLFYIPRVKSV